MTTARLWPNNMLEARENIARLNQSALDKLDKASHGDQSALHEAQYELSEALRWIQYTGAHVEPKRRI